MRQALTPDMKPIRARLRYMCLCCRVDQITIDVMFEDELGRIVPVVEYLTSHDVPSNAPAILVPL